MTKNTDFLVSSQTAGSGGMQGKFELDTGESVATQDVTKFVTDAKLERERAEAVGYRKDGYRKFATIPDIVAIKIKNDYGLDLHDPTFMHDPANLAKFKAVMMNEYRSLIVNT